MYGVLSLPDLAYCCEMASLLGTDFGGSATELIEVWGEEPVEKTD